jgi:monothiol glutaredoxin
MKVQQPIRLEKVILVARSELYADIQHLEFKIDTRNIMETIDKIKQQIEENPILLYMKGSPKLSNCGFSSQASQALMQCGEQFAYVDILQNPDIRSELPKYANWPTFPQLWVDGELIGGCDIIMEMSQQGELQEVIKESVAKRVEGSAE